MALNMLIVDDSETVRAVICKTLGLSELPIGTLYQAGNGVEALEILGKEWIDLVFADVNMPIMGGIELVNKMQENELYKTIPIIMVSTEGSATRIQELHEKGIKAFIRKPFRPENLKSTIQDILGVFDA